MLIVEPDFFLAAVPQSLSEAVLRLNRSYGATGLADRLVAGASAQVAAELIVYLPMFVEVVSVAGLKQGHHDSWGAVATLRSHSVDEFFLGWMQVLKFGEAFDGDNLFAVQHGQKDQARIDRSPGRLPRGRRVEYGDRAGSTITFSAAFLGAATPA